MKKLLISLLVTTGLLVSCGTAPTGLFKDRQAAMGALKGVQEKCNSLPSSADLTAFRTKFNDTAAQGPSVSQLANKDYLKPNEVIALGEMDSSWSICSNYMVEWAKIYQPLLVNSINEFTASKRQILADMLTKKLTLGEANGRLYEVNKNFVESWKKLDAQLYANQKREQDDANAQALRIFQILNSGGSTPVNCTTMGNSTTCL
jgi:hypothetical protein